MAKEPPTLIKAQPPDQKRKVSFEKQSPLCVSTIIEMMLLRRRNRSLQFRQRVNKITQHASSARGSAILSCHPSTQPFIFQLSIFIFAQVLDQHLFLFLFHHHECDASRTLEYEPLNSILSSIKKSQIYHACSDQPETSQSEITQQRNARVHKARTLKWIKSRVTSTPPTPSIHLNALSPRGIWCRWCLRTITAYLN